MLSLESVDSTETHEERVQSGARCQSEGVGRRCHAACLLPPVHQRSTWRRRGGVREVKEREKESGE